MLVEGGTARRQVVTTGIRDGGWVEIVSGLTPGQEIVTKAGSFVREGDRINPVPETATN
jgi:HlyD family secretion protein